MDGSEQEIELNSVVNMGWGEKCLKQRKRSKNMKKVREVRSMWKMAKVTASAKPLRWKQVSFGQSCIFVELPIIDNRGCYYWHTELKAY